MIVLTLPWPDSRLSPNARTHRMEKARLTKKARADAGWLTLNALGRQRVNSYRVDVRITFTPPRSTINLDNAIGAFKAAQDGIADAIGVPDERWNVTYGELQKSQRPASVLVEITETLGIVRKQERKMA